MVDPTQDVQFYFLASDGARQSSTDRALRAALSAGALSTTTLVWRSGWSEWLPANRVRELQSSIPESKRAPTQEPKRGPRVTLPPATPTRDATRAPEPAHDILSPSRFGRLGQSRRPAPPAHDKVSVTPPPPPSRGRSAMPTLSEEQPVVAPTATLRPPGAVPPPARGVPVPAFDSSPRASALVTPIPEPASIEPELDSTLELAPQVPAEARRTPIDPLLAALPATASEASAKPQIPAYRDSLVKIGRIGLDSRTVVMALSALSGALLVAVIGLSLSRSRRGASTETMPIARNIPPPITAPPASPGCTRLLPPARVAANIERGVAPYASTVANDGALALGIAASKTKGVGLRVDPNTLDVLPTYEEDGKDAVRSVVPLTRSSALAFFVDRDDRALRSAHTVDEIPPFTLGVSDAGFSRVVAGNASLVWALAADSKITEPRSAPVGDFGYGVTFRRGGQSGTVLVGFVGSDGREKSALAEIAEAPRFLGTPTIAGSANGALVAFAGRDAPEAPWKLYVSRCTPGQAPSPAHALLAGDGGSVISPSLAALSSGRWLVQWTEGGSEQYHVHVQSFAADLSPIGKSLLVSPKGANAGQGSLATFASGALSLFILTTAGHDELWGATLSCQ